MKSFFSVIIFLFSFYYARSQSTIHLNTTEELKFYEYLLRNNLKDDASKQYSRLSTFSNLTRQEEDSINYLTGWSLYMSKQLDSSTSFLLKVSPASLQYCKSHFFAAYNESYLRETDSALYILNNFKLPDEIVFQKLMNFERAGIALLRGDLDGFKLRAMNFDSSYYAITDQEKKLTIYYNLMVKAKTKSPVKAALLSAVVPGLGKIYANKTGEGVIGFVQIGALGLMTAESYNKKGISSARFIVAASLFSLFYVGNIWGSYFSVRIKQKEKRNEIENAILFDMHIPLRVVFN